MACCTSRPVAIGYVRAKSFTIMSSRLWNCPCARALGYVSNSRAASR